MILHALDKYYDRLVESGDEGIPQHWLWKTEDSFLPGDRP